MKDQVLTVLETAEIQKDIYKMKLAGDMSEICAPGQFVNIRLDGFYLRRPISIADWDDESLTIIFKVVGKGTAALAACPPGTSLSVLMPLGNGFFVEDTEQKVALVGGGVGVFPLISVLREYGQSKEISAYIGYRNQNAVCGVEEFAKAHKFVGVTDDGSYGEKMNAVQAFEKDLKAGNRPDVVLACGPTPMLRALKVLVEKENIPCYVSLEERMGCGIGACLVCVCDMTNGKRARVCKDGPVFNAKDVIL